MAISRMQQPRQLYGLGSLVKSIGKTVKKVVKSPIGKAALIGLGGAGLMGMGPFSGLAGIGSRIGGALFGGAGIGPAGKFGTTKGILGSLMGKVPGGGFTLGAIGSILAASGMSPEEIELTKRDPEKVKMYLRSYYSNANPDKSDEEIEEFVTTNTSEYAVGGRVGLMGGAMPTGVMRANKAGTIERDYRQTGGFVPVGIKEKADDVPAMLSKNEFVMTADAVRGMGGGSIEKGAQRLYDQMKTAEKRVV
tara:strand:+ start:81 stop:830 length:750 start_codon:yes stop_codon:yes gene_type:complete